MRIVDGLLWVGMSAVLGCTGCGDSDCRVYCEKVIECDGAGDVDDCIDRCEDVVEEESAFEAIVDECAGCLDGTSCQALDAGRCDDACPGPAG